MKEPRRSGYCLPQKNQQGRCARWTAGKATWNAFAGIPCQGDGRKSYLERFRGNSVPGGRQEKLPGTLSREFRARWEAGSDTWNAFAEIPWRVDGGEETPGTLSRGFRARWEAGKDTWNTFAGIPCQVDDRKCYLTRFCRDTVAGGRRRRDTWNAFAGIPWQVDGKFIRYGTGQRNENENHGKSFTFRG